MEDEKKKETERTITLVQWDAKKKKFVAKKAGVPEIAKAIGDVLGEKQ